MLKKKISPGLRIKHWFIAHPWIKLISFVLAILIWLYVQGEINTFYY